MSVINVIKKHNAVYLLTDGGVWLDTGQLCAAVPKVLPLPHMNSALAWRGNFVAGASIPMTMLLHGGATFDELKRWLRDHFRAYFEPMRAQLQALPGDNPDHLELILAGFNNFGSPEAWVVGTTDREHYKAFELNELMPLAFAPSPPEYLCGEVFEGSFDPVKDGLKVMEWQRRQPGMTAAAFAQLTTIEMTGISTRIIWRWQDRMERAPDAA